jgi:hypothetical protein
MMDPQEYAEHAVQDLLAADAVLPEQFWGVQDGTIRESGERGLMWAVLTDGIECYRRNAHGGSGPQREAFKEAEHWIMSTDWDWPFSFVNLCEAFGFDPAGVRRALRRWRSAHAAHVLPRQRFRPVTLHAA